MQATARAAGLGPTAAAPHTGNALPRLSQGVASKNASTLIQQVIHSSSTKYRATSPPVMPAAVQRGDWGTCQQQQEAGRHSGSKKPGA